MEFFDGKAVRDEIMKDLTNKVAKTNNLPTMAVFLIGNDPVSEAYVELKKKIAEKIGVQFCLYKFDRNDSEQEVLDCIEFLNNDEGTKGIMIQIPVPEGFDRDKLIGKISPKKDIDGLRFCAGLSSDFKPPVVLAILEAIKRSNFKIDDKTKIAQIGLGFLVGTPLEKTFKEEFSQAKLTVINKNTDNISKIIQDADIIISAAGSPRIIKEDMIKEGAVLIDAGTTEDNGQLIGDIDEEAYQKARYYTPVPGGIGPVTAAMLFKNLVGK